MNWVHNISIIVICFLLSRIIIDSGSHREIIRRLISNRKSSAASLIFVVLLLSYSLSLFFPNTIVVISLIPAVTPIIGAMQDREKARELSTGLGMAMIFGANIGGMGSMVGSPQNLIYLGFIELERIPGRENITFFTWLLFGIPFTLILLAVSYFVIKARLRSDITVTLGESPETVNGIPLKRYVIFFLANVLLIVLLTAAGFFGRFNPVVKQFSLIDLVFIVYLTVFIFISFLLPRSGFSAHKVYINFMNLCAFVLFSPFILFSSALRDVGRKIKLNIDRFTDDLDAVTLNTLNKVFGRFTGRKLASLSERAGDSHVSINRMLIELPFAGLIFMGLVMLVVFLAVTIGDNPDTPQIDGYIINFITSVSGQAAASLRGPLPLILITTLISIFLTEVFNNTTVILILFPIITSVSAGMGIDPLYLLLSVLLGASAAFMLPIATSVNAVVFGSMPDFSVKSLLFRGFILNLAGAVIITLFVLLMI